MPAATRDPIVVVGGSLAGLAAAARLAKRGHTVTLVERTDRLGGAWAPYALTGTDQSTSPWVDDGPPTIGFPAPWRDLFRKSGRPVEAELDRLGYALVPAPPVRYVFADGSELAWPTDRGGQYTVLVAAYGSGVAGRWQDLLDHLDDVWQALRPLGIESELKRTDRLPRALRRRLDARHTIAQLADRLEHPQLRALVRSVAHRQGSRPEATPAMVAVDLAVERTFSRWYVHDLRAGPAERDGRLDGRSSVLVDALIERLRLRRVDVRLGTEAVAIEASTTGVTAVRTSSGSLPAAGVVWAADPWSALEAIGPAVRAVGVPRQFRRLVAATTPVVSHRWTEGRTDPTRETAPIDLTVRLEDDGGPVVETARAVGAGTLHTVHDFRRGRPSRAAGLAWDGFASWTARPPVTTGLAGLFLAGPGSPGGPDPSRVVLTGALASYAADGSWPS